MDARPRILVVLGTRPEAVKVAPLILGLSAADVAAPVILTTGQHGRVADEVLAVFGLVSDFELPAGKSGKRGAHNLFEHYVAATTDHLSRHSYKAVVVQGDTTSAVAGACAAWCAGIPVIHLEAGLRTGNLAAPYPEEAHRRLIARLTSLHLAPTETARRNLLAEGVFPHSIALTGNTVVDALRWVLRSRPSATDTRGDSRGDARPVVLITAHRRESWGEPIKRIGRAVAVLSRRHPGVRFVVASHMNPAVREQLEQSLRGLNGVELTGPMAYQRFVRTLAGARLVLTDSGGVQEEAAALGIPALVTREVTERTDGLEAGAARIVGTSEESIVAAAHDLIVDDDLHAAMAGAAMRVYGDGSAAEKAATACAALLETQVSVRSCPVEDSYQRRRVSAMDAEAKWLYSYFCWG